MEVLGFLLLALIVSYWRFLLIVAIIVTIIVFIVKYLSEEKSLRELVRHENRPQQSISHENKTQRIKDCVSSEDIQYQISHEMQRVLANIEASEAVIKIALEEANNAVSAEWLSSYKKTIRISTNLEENLKYYANRNLEHSKFQYYTSLHFRSMLAADFVHKDYREIDASFDDINKLIVSIAQTGRRAKISKAQIYKAKDDLKELRNIFLNKVREMNQKTATLRDKIGNECGKRGAEWKAARMRNRA